MTWKAEDEDWDRTGWDWKRALPVDVWHATTHKGWPGWDRDPGGEAPVSVSVTVEKGKDVSSRDLAIRMDDLAAGPFYYRDWTGSGLPFVDPGERYQSRFWFKLRADRDRFLQLLGK